MRIDTPEFSQYNKASAQEPAFVVEIAFDEAATDLIYLTSHAIAGLTGEIFEGVLTDISGTTQKINPDKALSEIGSLSFSALDDDLTAKQRAKLNSGLGLRGKRARFYAGFRGLDWSTYTLVQTQIIRGASYKDMEYTWRCSDIQREMREQIFEVKQTSLAATLEPDDTEVQVYNTDGFNQVKQPDSPSGKTDAPGQKVGYIILEEDGQKEIIRYTGKTSTTFTGCTRGVLGTRPIRVEKSDDEGADNAPKVEEYVYLEMPAPMLAYAILTGSIYGEVGETLPDHWHLGIAPQYIRTSDYTNIGEDLWDPTNADLGLAARIAGVTDEDGKQFVEEQLFLLMGCYAPIYANGEIGLRRMTGVLSDASSIRALDRQSVMKYGSLEHDMNAIINRIVISWNWVDQREEYTRTNLLIDQSSIDTHGEADLKQLEFRALHGSRHSYNTLRNRFDALRDRYAGPPLRISLDLMPDQNDLEVGDIVRLQLDEVEDYSGAVTGIDRAFEVQQVKVNWKTGVVSVVLFGSSQKAQPLAPEQEGATLPDSVYAVPGSTEINSTNFPGAVSSSNGITTVSSDIDLTGSDNLQDVSAIYYCLEDLTINAGVTVTVSKNTQIRVKGFFQINGKIDGRGRGWDGGLGMDIVPGAGVENLEASLAKIYPSKKGYIGQPAGGGGFNIRPEIDSVVGETLIDKFLIDSRNRGLRTSADELSLNIEGGSLTGLPANLIGQPGSGGGSAIIRYAVDHYPRRPGIDGQRAKGVWGIVDFQPQSFSYMRFIAAGGAGGKSGAGLFLLCSGAELGSVGEIDLSGQDGFPADSAQYISMPGSSSAFDGDTIYGGRGGGGAPGAMYVGVVGATSNPPTLTSANSSFFYGDSSSNQAELTVTAYKSRSEQVAEGIQTASSLTVNGPQNDQPRGNPNQLESFTRIQFLNGEIAPAPDVPEYSEKPTALSVTEALNTPKTPNANLSTLEVSVSAPSDSAYSYALVEYRLLGTLGWSTAGPASPEALITVASDGATYEVRARSVSNSGVVSQDYVSTTFQTTKIIGADPGDPDVDEKIVIPPVRGLELEEQGNDTKFTGRDAKFVWRATTVSEWFEIGSEGQLGASAGELDLYFRDYQVEIWAQNKIVRTAWVKDPAFVYSYEKNAEDYARENGAAGAWRSFEIRVYCRGRLNQISDRPAKLSVSNPAPTNITGLAITAGFNVIEIVYKKPDDLDFAGVQVWISETSGFDPDAVEPVATIGDNSYVAGGLKQGQNYYVRLRPFDDFGIEGTTPTAEIMVTTRTGQDLDGLSGWAYEVDPVDRDFVNNNMEPGSINLEDDQVGGQLGSNKLANLAVIAEKLAGQAVTAEKIAALAVGTAAIQNLAVTDAKIKELSVAKLLAGVINATGPITTESILRAVDDINNPSVQVGIGPASLPVAGAQTSLLMWSVNSLGDVTFGVDELGNPYFSGILDAAGGSFAGALEAATGVLGNPSGSRAEYDGTNLIVESPFLNLNGTEVVFGDEPTGQYIKYSGGVFEVGPEASIGSNADRTVTVGSGGDFTTLNAALEYLSRTVPAYMSGGFTASIEILSGTTLSEQLHITGVNLGWVRIVSESDATVSIDLSGLGADYFVKCDNNAISPVFDFSGTETGAAPGANLFEADNGATLTFNDRGTSGNLVWSASQSSFLRAQNGSRVTCRRIDADNSILAYSGAYVDAEHCNLNGGAFFAQDFARLNASHTDVANVSLSGWEASSFATIYCELSSLSGTKPLYGVRASSGSEIRFSGNISGCGTNGAQCTNGAKITLGGGDVNLSGGDDLFVSRGGIISVSSGTNYSTSNVAVNALSANGIIFD